ncbi:MAG: protein-disulfide reductase DsbD domain-containing protein [Chitinophagaceae bacterium]
MIQKLGLFSLILFLSLSITAQIKNPVNWAFSLEKKSPTQYNIKAKATIEKGWHVYGLKKVDGPIATSLEITTHPLITIDGKTREIGKKVSQYEDIFSTHVEYFENTMTIVQSIKLKTIAKLTITGYLNFMACDNKNCTPPEKIPFSLSIQ